MPHVSMRKVGGTARDLLEALCEAVGPTGTLLMVLSAPDGEPFDALQSPVDTEDMGVFAEVFRTAPGVQVNDHAADRFAARGSQAAFLLNPTPLHDYHGPGSVLERFVQAQGFVLRLGANLDTITLTHHAEYLSDIPNKIRVRRLYVRADLGEQWIDSLDDSDGIAHWPKGDYFPQIWLDYRAAGRAQVGPIGACTAELFSSGDFVAFAVHWMNEYLRP